MPVYRLVWREREREVCDREQRVWWKRNRRTWSKVWVPNRLLIVSSYMTNTLAFLMWVSIMPCLLKVRWRGWLFPLSPSELSPIGKPQASGLVPAQMGPEGLASAWSLVRMIRPPSPASLLCCWRPLSFTLVHRCPLN